jgi:GntR family transcriptional regulator, galactonate operon transcriptional repressor
MPDLAAPRPRNFHDQIVDLLGRRMVAGELAPGARIPPEPQLAASLGVSRLALREAMKTLAAKGMVVIRPKTGTHVQPRAAWNLFDPDLLKWHAVQPLDDRFVADLMELRRMIEPAAARIAALRASRAQLKGVREAYAAMAAAPDQASYIAADLRLHAAVLEACDNPFIAQLQGAISEVLKVSFSASSSPLPDEHAHALALHEALVVALEARDEQAAAQAVERLIERAGQRIRTARGAKARKPRRAAAA